MFPVLPPFTHTPISEPADTVYMFPYNDGISSIPTYLELISFISVLQLESDFPDLLSRTGLTPSPIRCAFSKEMYSLCQCFLRDINI